jgi:hypothetical protein
MCIFGSTDMAAVDASLLLRHHVALLSTPETPDAIRTFNDGPHPGNWIAVFKQVHVNPTRSFRYKTMKMSVSVVPNPYMGEMLRFRLYDFGDVIKSTPNPDGTRSYFANRAKGINITPDDPTELNIIGIPCNMILSTRNQKTLMGGLMDDNSITIHLSVDAAPRIMLQTIQDLSLATLSPA